MFQIIFAPNAHVDDTVPIVFLAKVSIVVQSFDPCHHQNEAFSCYHLNYRMYDFQVTRKELPTLGISCTSISFGRPTVTVTVMKLLAAISLYFLAE